MSEPFNDTYNINQIFADAAARKVSAARVAIETNPHVMRDLNMWPSPQIIDEERAADALKNISICDPEKNKDILTQFTKSICDSVQFPINTAYLHGLGNIAAAMIHNFRYEYYSDDTKPVNLYVVGAQPPSSGKSKINSSFLDPVQECYQEREKLHAKERKRIQKEIDALYEELDSAALENEIESLEEDIYNKHQELKEFPLYGWPSTDDTPEGLELRAMEHDNTFRVISDEATAINTLLGLSYGDSDKKKTAEIILKGFDEEFMSGGRVTRKSLQGQVKGCIAVIAQDEVIDSILASGSQRTNGLNERFLLLREPTMLGKRDFDRPFQRIDPKLKEGYRKLVFNLVNRANTVLKFSDEAMEYIMMSRAIEEPNLADGGRYSHSLLRGTVGKMDKQVMKMSCVLHAVKEFCDGGGQSEVIDQETVMDAYLICQDLIKIYIYSVDSLGYSGEMSEISCLRDYFQRQLEKKPHLRGIGSLTLQSLRSAIKDHKVFKGKPKLTDHLRDALLPSCEKAGLCVFHDDRVFINPKITM